MFAMILMLKNKQKPILRMDRYDQLSWTVQISNHENIWNQFNN